MTGRELAGYLVLVLLVGFLLSVWWRQRRARRLDHQRRWGRPSWPKRGPK